MSRETITINSLNSEGEGVGSLNGLKVFVAGTIPGEVVSVHLTQQKKNYARAELLSVLSPSAERALPPCPLFGSCGGCQIMHIQSEAQLRLKTERVRDALKKIGGLQDIVVPLCLPSPSSLGYRNKIQLPVIWDNNSKTIGLYKKNSHEIIPIKNCLIQCPQGEEILKLVIEKLQASSVRYVLIRNAVFEKEALLVFVTSSKQKGLKILAEELMNSHSAIKGVVENFNPHLGNTILGRGFNTLAGRSHIFETLLGKRFKISPAAFFQVNPKQAENLYAKALEFADLKEHEIVLDAYCGVGAFALFAAEHAKQVYGIECIPEAIQDAKENAKHNQIGNAIFLCGKAEKMIEKIGKIDAVFLNPPRKGCAEGLLKTLLKKGPQKMIYISCDPATLARDLAILRSRYAIKCIQPFDMFPQTMHVETIVLLQLR